MIIKIDGFQMVGGIDLYTARQDIIVLGGARWGSPPLYNTAPGAFSTLHHIESPHGALIFAKSLTGLTTVEVPSGVVSLAVTEEYLIQNYTERGIYLREHRRTAREWAGNPSWCYAAGSGSTDELAALGLTLTQPEWEARVTLAANTPEERYQARVEADLLDAPEESDTYAAPETILVLDEDYWYPYKVTFAIKPD